MAFEDVMTIQCVACSKSLTLFVQPEVEDQGPSRANKGLYIDDDVKLQCGCHFHWECLLEAYSMDSCPNCGKSLISSTELGEQQLLCTLANEGGVQDNLDILPILREESYLKAYPEERKCRAFLEFCAEGDVEAIVDLLNDDEDDDEDMAGTDKIAHNIDILRYTDQIGSMGSGLHVAVQNGKTEAAWMLLFLASTLDTTQIPQKMLEGAVELGVERDDQSGKVDIRSLKDSGGLTAEERAVQVGRPWQEWVQSGLLRTPQV